MQTDVLTVEPELTVGDLMKTLMERGIFAGERGGYLRIAPHFYNTADEVRACLQAIRDILDSGEHRRYLGQARRPG